MPADDLYWSPVDFDSEESNNFYKSYIDPWDLENYAYIRQHLDPLEASSRVSSTGNQLESTSTFTYLPGGGGYGSIMNSERTTSNYAAIDEIDVEDLKYKAPLHRNPPHNSRKFNNLHQLTNEQENQLMYVYDAKGKLRKIAVPVNRSKRARSYSYSDGYEPIDASQKIYSGLEEARNYEDPSIPIYDDIKMYPTASRKFGLSRYGHLKIDYSYSWTNLHKYISN